MEGSSGVEVFFKPRSIAVVGASPRQGSVGRAILENLLSEYRGRVYPVNPKYSEILGLRSYASLLDIPEPPELAVITVRAGLVPGIARDAGEAGVRGLVVVSGGFAEAGEEGRRLEEELVSVVRKYGMRLVGPNCIGVYDATTGVDTFFIPRTRMRRPPLGPIAVVSQSGAFLTTFMDFIASEGVGIVRAINIGNKADVDEVDLIDYLSRQGDVEVIMLYLEDVKPGRGQDLMKAALDARRRGKRIVLLKGGRTESGARAASSHTAALAGDYKVLSSAARQAGIIEVDGPVEFLDAAKALSLGRTARGKRVALLTHAGGPGVISTDLLTSRGLEVPPSPPGLAEELRQLFPPRVAVGNPIDLTGDATEEDYDKALNAIRRHEFGDIVYIIAYIQPPTITSGVGDVIARHYGEDTRPYVVVTGGSREGEELARRLYKVHGIPTYTLLERAVNAAGALYRAGIEPCTSEWRPGPREPACPEAGWLRDDEALRVAAEAGIPVPKYCYAASPEEAADCYRRLGARRAVVKLASSRIKHKSDVGGVVLGVESPQEAARAYRLIEERLEERGLSEAFEGVVVMEMVEDGIEVFVGARWDPSFGPVVAFGGGGIFVELYRDVSVRIAPLSRCEAMRMIGETRIGSALAAGYRGLQGNVDALVDLLVGVSRLLATGRLVEADLNPVIVGRSGVRAVDVKIRGCL